MLYVPEECIDSSEHPDTNNYTGMNFEKYSAANVKYTNTYFCQHLINTNPTNPRPHFQPALASDRITRITRFGSTACSLILPTYNGQLPSLKVNNKLRYLRGKGQKPVDKTTDRIRVKGDESGGKNANGVGSYSADGWGRNMCILSLT
jgi:hypothetical protein